MWALGSSRLRLSTAGPPADLMAPATSAAVTEPNSLPLSRGSSRSADGVEAFEGLLDLVGVLHAADFAGGLDATDVVDLLLGATSGLDGQAAGQQVVAARSRP